MKLLVALAFFTLPVHAEETKAEKNAVVAPEKPATTQVEDTAQPLTAMGVIDGESDQGMSLVTARFSKKPSWENLEIEDHGTFIQVKLPNTIVANSGVFYEGNSPYVKKIAAFQTTNTSGALRMFVNKDAAKVKLASKIDMLGDRFVVTVDHSKLEQLLVSQLPTEKGASEVANQIVNETTVTKSIPEPAKEIKNTATGVKEDVSSESNAQMGSALQNLNLKEKFTAAAIFSIVMLCGLGVLLALKPILRKRALKSASEDAVTPVSMKLLSSMAVAPKQKLSLIQVGDQQILIGISADNVSYITTVNKKPTQTAFVDQLSSSRQVGEITMKKNPMLSEGSVVSKTAAPLPPRRVAPPKTEPQAKSYDDISKVIKEKLKRFPSI